MVNDYEKARQLSEQPLLWIDRRGFYRMITEPTDEKKWKAMTELMIGG